MILICTPCCPEGCHALQRLYQFLCFNLFQHQISWTSEPATSALPGQCDASANLFHTWIGLLKWDTRNSMDYHCFPKQFPWWAVPNSLTNLNVSNVSEHHRIQYHGPSWKSGLKPQIQTSPSLQCCNALSDAIP